MHVEAAITEVLKLVTLSKLMQQNFQEIQSNCSVSVSFCNFYFNYTSVCIENIFLLMIPVCVYLMTHTAYDCIYTGQWLFCIMESVSQVL